MYVSIIIPTYNRFESLKLTLDALSDQTYSNMEVIVVDDGSTDNTSHIQNLTLPFELVYLTQQNSGATEARNLGARHARGDLLIFMDDDIELSATQAIFSFIDLHEKHSRVVVLGQLLTYSPTSYLRDGNFVTVYAEGCANEIETVQATECFTGLLSIKKRDFFALEMFQDPTGGWPNWDDVDFGYRAHLAGYQILRNNRIQALHRDVSVTSIEKMSRRWYNASKSAVRLFQRHPELRTQIPMFRDKLPIEWLRDSPGLIAKKLMRRLISLQPILRVMEAYVSVAEQHYLALRLLTPFYRWINGAYMLHGYREGLKENRKSINNITGRDFADKIFQ